MELLNITTMDANDLDITARELLGSELAASGITCAVTIWTDEGNAYLDDETMYSNLAAHFNQQSEAKTGIPTTSYTNYTREQLNDTLYDRYTTLFEEVEEELKKQTMQAGPVPNDPETSVLTWRQKDGWYSCLSGTHEGNYAESEDQGPFEERADAEQAALEK